MTKFRKEILPAGEYLVTRPDGSRTLKKFSAEYLKEVAKNTGEMIKAGLRIPAPFKHHKDAVPVDEKIDDNSYDNAGYWDDVVVEDVKGVPTLCGVVDAGGDEKENGTPAWKLANTIKEVSACVVDTFTDGKNRKWGPSMLHAAPVIHPVVPGQEGFSLMSNAVCLSSSAMLSVQSDADASVAALSKALAENVNIYLPPGTPANKVVDVLMVSVEQYKLASEGATADTEVVETTSLYMSLNGENAMPFTKTQAQEVINLGLLHPQTKEAIKLEDLNVIEDTATPEARLALALQTQATEERKDGLRNRVTALVNSGRVTKEFAESDLYPQIDSYKLSIGDDQKFQASPLDTTLKALEALPAVKKADEALLSTIPDGTKVATGENENDEPTKEELEQLEQNMLAMM